MEVSRRVNVPERVWLTLGAGLLGALLLAGCSPVVTQPRALAKCARTNNFALSLASSYGGQPTPKAAAEWDASHHAIPGFALPLSGWQVVSRKIRSASVRSGEFQVHAVEGPDGTWQVDEGYRCVSGFH